MAGGITIFLCSLVLLCSLTQGQENQCPPTIKQFPTGKQVGSKPVWRVIIKNPCVCTDFEVKLSATPDFKSLIPIDPSILSKDSTGLWLIKNGDPIYGGDDVTFFYASNRVNFAKSLSFRVACS
ncbi:hypothetical protein DH2020_008426 [Rehmannia glutinosa]|uniref:Uncharacterized protein n=1 Tax=Rehmannia glutinosa TaxID=99300 RepID=A0ABR0U1N0_REHGL